MLVVVSAFAKFRRDAVDIGDSANACGFVVAVVGVWLLSQAFKLKFYDIERIEKYPKEESQVSSSSRVVGRHRRRDS